MSTPPAASIDPVAEGARGDPNRDNYAFAQTLDFGLELMPLLSAPFGFDITRTMVFYALARASVSHLNHHNRPRDEAVDGIFPNDMRRPVSILSIAGFLGMPYETVRRHIHALVADGWCARVGSREFIVLQQTLSDERIASGKPAILEAMRTFVARMRSEAVSTADGKGDM